MLTLGLALAGLAGWRGTGCAHLEGVRPGVAGQPPTPERPVGSTPGSVPRVAPRPLPRPVRAIWVARTHYRYPDDVRTIIRNCAALGMNTVLWQVRGNATVCYPSQLEPWAEEFDFESPGYDPLALAVAEAHAHGLRIEAWVNVLPGWRGPRAPPISNQLYHTHPEWFLRDAQGRMQPLGDFYILLNPCLAEVRAHIAAVIGEIAGRYDVDGVHLDYVRYAWETVPDAERRYPRDPRTLSLYHAQTGRSPDADPNAWKRWRADQLTLLVEQIRQTLHAARPGATLTAAVRPDPDEAYRGYLQDSAGWMRSGLLDAVMPMAYTTHLATFRRSVQAYRAIGGARVVPGLGVYKHLTREQIRSQLDWCRQTGGDLALFSYDALYASADDRRSGGPAARTQSLRAMRREIVGVMSE